MSVQRLSAVLVFSALAAALSPAGGAAEPLAIEKTKTGILPDGGFYGLYEVQCRDSETAAIGALSRRAGPWCVARQGELQCFPRSQAAAWAACNAVELAGADAAPSEAVQ